MAPGLVVSSALDEAAKPPVPGAGAVETLPAPGSSGTAGPVVTNRADEAEYGGALVMAAEVAVE